MRSLIIVLLLTLGVGVAHGQIYLKAHTYYGPEGGAVQSTDTLVQYPKTGVLQSPIGEFQLVHAIPYNGQLDGVPEAYVFTTADSATVFFMHFDKVARGIGIMKNKEYHEWHALEIEVDRGPQPYWLSLDPSFEDDSQALVLKLDPALYNVQFIEMISGHPWNNMDQYRSSYDALAAFNAGMYMYHDDGSSSPHGGLWHGQDRVYRSHGKNLNGQIIFGDTLGIRNKSEAHNETTFSKMRLYRMISKGKVVWQKDKKFWSSLTIGKDKDGMIYIIQVRSPYTMNHLAHMLLERLELTDLFYLEGGPEATLSTRQITRMGSYETGFNEDQVMTELWGLPMAFIVVPKQ